MINTPSFFESLVESSQDLISVLDRNGKVLYVNSCYEKVLGHKRDELLNKHFSEVISFEESSLEYILSVFDLVMAGEKTEDFKVEIFHREGYPLTFLVKYTVLEEEDYLKIVLKNITEEIQLRRVQNDLIEKNELFANLLDHTGIGIIITDPNQEDNPIVYHNKGFEAITGYTSNEIIGRNCRFLQGPLTNRKTVQMIKEKLESGKEVKVDILNYRKDQTTFWNELCINPVINEKGELSHFIGIQKDVTRRKELEIDLLREFRLARKIQQLTLSQELDEEKISIYGTYFPSHEVGGDLYKWQKIDDDLYFLLIMDVMGHGLSASLLTMSIQTEISSILKNRNFCLSKLMGRLNEHMIGLFSETEDDSLTRMYFTCIAILINTKQKRITYVNAGHPSFIIGNEIVREIPSNEIPVGLIENHSFQSEILEYEDGAGIFLYTDGLLEYLNISMNDLKEKTKDKNLFVDLSKEIGRQPLKDDVCFVQVALK